MITVRQKYFIKHVKINHAVKKSFICKICVVYFAQKEDFTKHVKPDHDGKKPI